ncbi:class I SAM-dependent methyltransferase [Jeotgalibacillus terrae]|uniref:Class I SAM-dependent methyltransferase n=1 Tax=Jeotgalibacillus terrae TaxID=587735 RepID=A0ABW5ZHJ0_9BACL|nr:class I SAM-dependent methyltransferase [Jeotgalibacillus terrae]MBM7579529.1 cyclopropane fatty-acyl-phospholipid synthase-like methyltransferase [Jeotgalibacillus terrae]
MSVPFFKQFSHPEGKAGKVAGFIMSKENRKLNRWASGCLDLHPGEHVLEIGFGSGACIEKLLKKGVTVDGLDASASMAESAEKRLTPMIESGRVRIMQGKAEHIHLPENYYDKILSVNNFPIWGEPDQALERLYSSLKSDGRIVITVQPREDNASPNLTRMVGNDLYHRLEKAGFAHITLTYRYFWPHMAVTAVGFKEKRGS